MVRSFLAVILPLVSMEFAFGAIYKTVDKDGNVTFTDSRPADQPSEEVKLRPITPISPVPGSEPEPLKSAQKPSRELYSSLEIIEPADDATVRTQENFMVKIATAPKILAGHKVRLLLNGQVVGESRRKLTFELKNVDRGTHNLTVEIIDNQANVIKSSSNTIHVHRTIYTPAVSINPPAS
ncbi:DUF4124 domain-containing protein [Endozoicomonas sp. SCSIO W0465]|uniref:DUF4124 domain-containing protein n=1 Tax=Endozoicomonas sp. SCSIO W0465 TaxID=2918516 RepID=UPI002075646F|nr:DUF4124 domain-containing protein [Endozoicomonas sp. SCSIO W0465]USE37063.1 DUF4124 domain-containing protein [Endozoicomonas sp. SCSIO W0465]